MNQESGIRNFYYFAFGFFLVFIDQLSKYLIRLRHPADGGFYICNKNIAWGIEVPAIFFWLFWSAVLATLIFILFKKCFMHNTLCVILIIAGAISNAIDRLIFGCVIDFIDLKFWPVFNLADVFIILGVGLLIAKYLKL